ncbi:hybrid sensor histidine kinase/response regulator [Roseivivax sediminis]|uniref:histidine kinase n=1 Tax=Roseivivax sediminis TaxID=936889 RepID=A0A1I1X857_9RHOB|nr:PAS-domain containing protein [Roseivivax sediminis]SFE03527.1 Signal transduction histidine kinase [Roseivivax sediminis]
MTLIDPSDDLARQNEKLVKIAEALMRRVEHQTAESGAAYAQFERAALLEQRVRERTRELERTLDLLHDSNARLAAATDEAEAARRNLADAIGTLNEGFALFDPEERLVMCNARFCRDFRDSVRDLAPGLAFADYVRQVSRARALALPPGVTPEDWAVERLRRHRDRHVMFNVELTGNRWLQVSEHRTGNGGTVVVQTDVTDIVQIERQERARLKDSQARMIRATLDHLNQGVAIFDGAGRLVGWNERIGTLLAISARFLRIGAGFDALLDRLPPDFAFTGRIGRAEFSGWADRRGATGPIRFEVRRATSQVLDVFGQGMPDGGFVLSVTDVTQEREAAQRLADMNEALESRVMERTLDLEDALAAAERANASKNRFVAAASHDLLQPLSAAKLLISSLSDRLSDRTDRATLGKAESALTSAEALIEALLDISKLESDRLSFDIRPIALEELLAPLRDQMEVLAAEKGLGLTVVPSGLWVESDPTYLRRVIQNLISNAVRYTAHGRVLVGVRRRGSAARIEVHDTGPGIAEADQSAIFEEFRRLDARASRNDGLGLGLAIVERACARLGHPVGLRSELGRGSCFMVSVPVAGHGARPGAPRLRPMRPAGLADAGLIVLLVENDPDLRRALVQLVEGWGVSVIEAEDADGALDLLDDLDLVPDAALIDQQLGPGRPGTALYQAIRERWGAVPTAIITADRSDALRRDCAALGLPRLLKPIDRTALAQFLKDTAAPPV